MSATYSMHACMQTSMFKAVPCLLRTVCMHACYASTILRKSITKQNILTRVMLAMVRHACMDATSYNKQKKSNEIDNRHVHSTCLLSTFSMHACMHAL
jgi:hypothetical protein